MSKDVKLGASGQPPGAAAANISIQMIQGKRLSSTNASGLTQGNITPASAFEGGMNFHISP